MSDKSVFTDDEWHALTEAPLLVTAAVFIVGEHGPISMVKEASASAKADFTARVSAAVANELVGQIVAEANTKETRHELKEHRGATPQAAIESTLHDLAPVAEALEEVAAGRIRTGRGVVRGDRRSGRAVGQEGQSRRAGNHRQDRRTVRSRTRPS